MNMISENIRYLREKRKLSQKELAEILGISNKTVSKWENGLGLPDIQMIVPLSQALGVSTDFILKEHPTVVENQADKPLSRKEQLLECLALLREKYCITTDQLLVPLQMTESELASIIMNNFPSSKNGLKEKQNRLIKLLVILAELIPRFIEDPHILASSLYERLQSENALRAETIESYVGLEAGSIERYYSGLCTLTSKQFLSLVISLFMLDQAFNPDTAFPRDS